jgi:hypothetical protein
MGALLFWFVGSSQKNFPIITNELFHCCRIFFSFFFNLKFKVFCVLHFLRFSFHYQSIMNVNSQNVYMNGVRKYGEGFLLSIADYGIGIGEVQGVGSGDGGLGFKASLSVKF